MKNISSNERPVLTCFVTLMLSFLSLFCQSSQTQRTKKENITEVVLIAANHAFMFLHPGYSPAHLRALLTKIEPNAIGIEKLPEWRLNKDAVETFPQEMYAVITWAHRRGTAVYGVDCAQKVDPGLVNGATAEQSDDASTVEKRWEGFRQTYRSTVTWEATQAFGDPANDIVSFHQMENLRQAESIMQGGFSPEEQANNSARESGIVQNIISLASKYPGGRIAIVFGAGHTLSLARRLQGQANVRVTSVSDFLPLIPQEVERGWNQDDAILLLGESLDSWLIPASPQSRDHGRTKELLDRLSAVYPAPSPISSYYQAKWRLLLRDFEGATKILCGVEEGGLSYVLPYVPDRRWCWPPLGSFKDKVKFTLATIYDMQDQHGAASALYQSMLEPQSGIDLEPIAYQLISLEWHYDPRAYIESLIKEPYGAGPREAFRALDCRKLVKQK